MANAAGGFRHYAGLSGTKQIYVGSDGSAYNYTSLADAVAAAQNNDCILIEPGTYTLTTALSITKPLTLKGIGGPNTAVITSALATYTINLQNPATGAAATYNYFENLSIQNSSTGDCIEIDNDGGATGDMVVKFDDCSIINSGGGLAIDLDQTTNTIDEFIYVSGQKCFHTLSASNLGLTKADSTVAIENMMISDALVYSATNVAYIITLDNCNVVSDAATTGGSASAILNYVSCTTMATPWGGIAAASVGGDFDATAATETLLSLS
jgi:hypothetical protein